MAKETAEQKLAKMMQKSAPAAVAASSSTRSSQKISFVFSMRTLNQILFLGILVCIAGLVYEMRSGMDLLSKQVDFSDQIKAPNAIAEIALPSSKDVAFYLDKVNTRNIFRPYEAEVASKPVAVSQTLAKKMAKYKLVGVAWLDLPETASIMIEDTENKTTSFLRQGDQLEGVTVKTIYTDRAVFSYENEETIIKL